MRDEDATTAITVESQVVHDLLGTLLVGHALLELLEQTANDLAASETTYGHDHLLTGKISAASCGRHAPWGAWALSGGCR